ncbi:MAG: MerR family transcriptional regulator [Geminicoccaceae bacterium]|jgi:DNA-binding transcriptional MerR regulator|nr:MerR family transcriptional regulator [Geminicoccaceae bacterium]
MKSSPNLEPANDAAEGELTIGQLAARFGLATHVLRHWEDVGLIEPTERVNGRRRYRPWHVSRVATILLTKQAGLTLDQIKAIFDAPDGPARKELLRRHRDELDRRLAGMEASRQMVQHGIDCRAGDFTRCPNFLRIVQEMAAGRPGRADYRRARRTSAS